MLKESQIYNLAQGAVMQCDYIPLEQKLEILHLLMDREDVAKFVEKREAQENGETV